jgi:hypothetical protein
MNLYPLNLVLAVAIATATLFFGYLPIRLLTARFFTRWTLRLGALWLAVAAITPPEILHYFGLLALLGFIAWWRLHGDHGLGGKLWLCAMAGFGLSLGPVLILAVTPGAWPAVLPAWAQALFLASLYTGGAIPGLAIALYIFTRRGASEAGFRTEGYARLLVGLTIIRIALALLALIPPLASLRMNPAAFYVFLLVPLVFLASKRIKSPRPSTAGRALSLVVIIGIGAEVFSLL